MEYLLMELFGGGIADWEMIGETGYDWHEILERAKNTFGDLDNINFKCLLETIFEMAKEDFIDMINEFIEENDKEYKDDIDKLKSFNFDDEEHWYFNTNYLDNDIMITVDEDIKKILDYHFEDEIDEINDNIGFTYIEINVE